MAPIFMERQLACKSCPGPSSPNFFTNQWRDEEGSAAPGHRRTGAAAMGEVALDLDAPGLIAGSLVAPLLRRAKGRGSMSRMLWREG